jgi:hypothetical protein
LCLAQLSRIIPSTSRANFSRDWETGDAEENVLLGSRGRIPLKFHVKDLGSDFLRQLCNSIKLISGSDGQKHNEVSAALARKMRLSASRFLIVRNCPTTAIKVTFPLPEPPPSIILPS